MQNSKKILLLLGISFLLILLLIQNTNAEEGKCVPAGGTGCNIPPEYRSDACGSANSSFACSKIGGEGSGCCKWESAPPAQTTCNICPGCGMGVFEVCTWSCIITYLLLLPIRVVLFIIALIGMGVALIIIFVGFNLLPSVIQVIIEKSLSAEFYYQVFSQIQEKIQPFEKFALSFISLFLVIIGLATILRIAEYQAKKALVPLLIVALLIRFAFPISQKIIELGNDLTKKIQDALGGDQGDFLKASLTFDGLRDAVTLRSANLLGIILCLDGRWDVFFFSVPAQGGSETREGPIIVIIMLAALYFWVVASIAMFILSCYITFGMIFLMRSVFFIGLTLVSPIAFLTAALRTKEMKVIFPGFLNWEEWWKTFLEWSFVGVSLLIWLSVAGMVATLSFQGGDFGPEGILKAPSANSALNSASEVVKNLILYLLPSLGAGAAIFIGSVTAPKLGQQFASGAFKFLNQVGQMALTGATVAIGAVAGPAILGPAATKIGGTLGKFGEGLTSGISKLQQKAGKKKWAIYAIPGIGQAIWAGGMAGKAIGVGAKRVGAVMEERGEGMLKPKLPKDFDEKPAEEQAKYIKNFMIGERAKAFAIQRMAEKGNLAKLSEQQRNELLDLINLEKLAKGDAFQKEAAKSILSVLPNKLTRKIMLDLQIEPQLAQQAHDDVTARILYFATRKGEDVQKMAKSVLFTPEVMEGILRNRNASEVLRAAYEKGGYNFVENYNIAAIQRGYDWFTTNNLPALTYLQSSPARRVGYTSPPPPP